MQRFMDVCRLQPIRPKDLEHALYYLLRCLIRRKNQLISQSWLDLICYFFIFDFRSSNLITWWCRIFYWICYLPKVFNVHGYAKFPYVSHLPSDPSYLATPKVLQTDPQKNLKKSKQQTRRPWRPKRTALQLVSLPGLRIGNYDL